MAEMIHSPMKSASSSAILPIDMAAFMELVKLPFTCQGPWKIYGNPRQSLGFAERYRCCRCHSCIGQSQSA